ncbi:UBX-domain-containing protein [Patellaria atrata CBS 101060]|uniref:UBX-domain-containing protein n=1 Tax=Patellaria atrata CBS 101060 TaxID=1346257 RepID=A0A9P4VVE5_9PEZI|nr:UBX-domain-containing protein [Patellaria atrata CBS 101060]
MADSAIDISTLSEAQQLALQQFTSVTDQDLGAAIPLLQRCQWNVQIAIARFFDGEPADPTSESVPEIPQPRDIRRQETLLNGFSSSSRSASSPLEPAPRIVPQPESQVARPAPLLLSVLFAPFNIAYSIISRSFGLLAYLFPFLPRLFSRITARNSTSAARRNTSGRRPLNTRDTAARFIREFEEEYGSNELPFFENGYAQAFDLAKKELKFLVVVLLSMEHDDTSSWVKKTLLSQEVMNFLKDPANNIIFWAGNVQDAEAYQVSNALSCTKFPFAGVIVHTPSISSTSMSLVARIAGPTTPSEMVSKVRSAITQYSSAINGIRASRAEQQASRDLREAQNSAYQRSLAQDRERARRKKEAEEARRREELEAREKQEAFEREARNLAEWKLWRAQSIVPEPDKSVKDVVRISLRMPDGERVVRRFAASLPLEELYAFVECYEVLQSEKVASEAKKPERYIHEYKFQLVSPVPRAVYELEGGGTIQERIGRSGNLIVERTDLDDEDDDE